MSAKSVNPPGLESSDVFQCFSARVLWFVLVWIGTYWHVPSVQSFLLQINSHDASTRQGQHRTTKMKDGMSDDLKDNFKPDMQTNIPADATRKQNKPIVSICLHSLCSFPKWHQAGGAEFANLQGPHPTVSRLSNPLLPLVILVEDRNWCYAYDLVPWWYVCPLVQVSAEMVT